MVWYQDTDGDGFGNASATTTTCTQPIGYVSQAGDLCATDPNKINPGVCGCGFTEASCVSTATIPSTTKSTVVLFPNPVTVTTLYFSESISGSVYDAKGSVVFSFTDLESIDTSIMENGLYMIYANTGDTYKFIVDRK